jgi:hypothetical protein
MKKIKRRRSVADFRKGIRKNPPKVDKSIDKLIDKFMKDDKPAFDKRFARS